MGTKLQAAKLERAAGKLQPALRLLGQLRSHLDRGSPSDSGWFAHCGLLVEELEAELFSLEATIGVVTQATLFEDETGCTEQEAGEPAAEVLVDCDKCGQEVSVPDQGGNFAATCPACGQEFEVWE